MVFETVAAGMEDKEEESKWGKVGKKNNGRNGELKNNFSTSSVVGDGAEGGMGENI